MVATRTHQSWGEVRSGPVLDHQTRSNEACGLHGHLNRNLRPVTGCVSCWPPREPLDVVHLPADHRTRFQPNSPALRRNQPRRCAGLPRPSCSLLTPHGMRPSSLGTNVGFAHNTFGSLDDIKLHSSAKLFTQVSAPESVFCQLLDRFLMEILMHALWR